MNRPAFEVSKEGLAKLLARRGVEFAVLELLQNALDEEVTRVAIRLDRVEGARRRHILTVEDDCPTGFKDLSHAYTLYAESDKKRDPAKRGRFNLGEKLVVALCDTATIETTTGTIRWENNARHHSRAVREAGSRFCGELRLDPEAVERIGTVMTQVLVPPHVVVTWQGERLPSREPIRVVEATLPTEIADDDGYLRPSERRTTIEVYRTLGEEPGLLYEMGLPVVDTGDTYHVSVQQKIPLNSDRDGVTPSFLRRVRTVVLNAMADDLTEETATAPWVAEALASPDVSSEAVVAVMDGRYGELRVVRDPSDPEGTKLAMSKGYAIIEPGSFNAKQWDSIRRSGAALPAGRVTPSPKVAWSATGTDVTIPEERWSAGLRRHIELARLLGQHLLDQSISVTAVSDAMRPYSACWGGRSLTYNVGRLGWDWFKAEPFRKEHLDLLIHEIAHHYSDDHLSSKYHDALSLLGAKLAVLALRRPELFLKAA